MEIALISGEVEFHVPVPSEAATIIHQEMSRMVTDASRDALATAMLRHLTQVLSKLLDPDLRPPTEKQLAFATYLARKNKVEIPRDALIYRFEMADFIDRYAPRKPGERQIEEGAIWRSDG